MITGAEHHSRILLPLIHIDGFSFLESAKRVQEPQAVVGRTTFEMFCTITVSGVSPSQSKTSNSSPKSQNNCLKINHKFLFFVCLLSLFSQIFDILHSPTQSFGVGYNKLDSVCVTEITETLLIVQRGVREDHHLETEDKPTSSKMTGNN